MDESTMIARLSQRARTICSIGELATMRNQIKIRGSRLWPYPPRQAADQSGMIKRPQPDRGRCCPRPSPSTTAAKFANRSPASASQRFLNAIRCRVALTSSELSAMDISDRGIVLTGGGALIKKPRQAYSRGRDEGEALPVSRSPMIWRHSVVRRTQGGGRKGVIPQALETLPPQIQDRT